MAPPIPGTDGDVNCYNLSNSGIVARVYFVNGMRVLPREHALTAAYLSLLIERPVWGVYNSTAGKNLGSIVDVLQCGLDYTQNALARPWSQGNKDKTSKVNDQNVEQFLRDLESRSVVWNKATLSLFKELIRHRHERQLIVAHSQGNLITSNALFVMEDSLGWNGLQNVRVYSLASPSPGWPLGLRITNGGGGRQDNAFMNDMVALLRPHNLAKKVGVGAFQNAGDFRTYPGALPVSLTPHDTNNIIDTLNFLKSIRGDLGLPKDYTQEFMTRSAKIADAAFPETIQNKSWFEKIF